MSSNFKDSIKQNINLQTKDKGVESKPSKDINTKFVLRKKKFDKTNKKAFNVYMQNDLVDQLDKLVKKSGYSRNELISMMCKWCCCNLEFEE